MDDRSRRALEGLRDAGAAMLEAHELMTQAHGALARAIQPLTDAAAAVLEAKDEHEDLRDTVDRLETLVLELVDEVKALRRDQGGT